VAATKKEIRQWLEDAEKEGATHVIIVCDTFDHEDYPVKVMPEDDVKKKMCEYSFDAGNMQKVMEVYSLTGKYTIDMQLDEFRAFHYD